MHARHLLLACLNLGFLFAAAPALAAETPAELVERSVAAVRRDPEQSRALAEQALALLAARPDADLQVRAHVLLCDFHSERDRDAAQRHAQEARRQLPAARRQGLQAALLVCEGEMLEQAGDNAQAMPLHEQAVAAAEAARDDEMLAGALFARGYLRGAGR